MATTNIALETLGVAISVLLLVCCCIEVPASKKQNHIFIAMFIVNIVVLTSDALTWVFEERAELTVLLYILNFLVYSCGYLLTALFTWYLIDFISARDRMARWIMPLIGGFCFAAILPVIVSLFNHMYFSFDNGVYVRGPLFWISQFYPIAILCIDMLLVIAHRRVLGRHDTVSFMFYGITPVIAMSIQIHIYGITLLYLASTLSLLTIYVMVHVEQNKRIEQQKAEIAQANIAIMLSQIQPHFLYNSLATITHLCDTDPSKAKEATVIFAKYLRGNIDSIKQKTPVPFQTELNHIHIYLYLEKIRFQDCLNIVYNIGATDFVVPSLTIQPLVENAVKYGVCQKEEGGTVTISTAETPDFITVTVTDDGAGFDPNEVRSDGRTHIGIDNVRSRLAAMCHATLTVTSTIGSGTTVLVKIPKVPAAHR